MESSPLISIGLPVSLFIIMVGIGLTLTLRDFGQVTRNPKSILVGTIAQILVMPLAAFAIAEVLGLAPALAVGLVIIAACPGGTTSNLFALLARGHIALSILLTVSASLITILTLPLFTNYALQTYMGEGADISLPAGKTIVMLLVIVLLPVAIGMFVRTRAPETARKAEGIVSIFGGVVLLALIVVILWGARERLPTLLSEAGPAAFLLNLTGLIVGLGFSRMAGLSPRESLAVAIELGIKNGTIALMVTLTLLESSDMSVPAVIYSIMMYGFGAVLIGLGRKLVPAPTAASAH